MNTTASLLSYDQTGYFSKIVSDYVKQAPQIQPFLSHPVSIEGVKASIEARKNFPTNRALLVSVLNKQYADIAVSEVVAKNIQLLLHENTFTLCTAHQPNVFTGPLYFIYKILHVAKLSAQLKTIMPENNFVPVYYMGSEDADLDELGHIYIDGEKYEWQTSQTGAVGRMRVDKALVNLINGLSGQLLVHPFGTEIADLMKACYKEGVIIEHATLQVVNHLFADYGVVIILPDNAELKASFIPVIERELMEEFSHSLVEETIAGYPAEYKAQASGRELNLFYLKDDKRERIEMQQDVWTVLNLDIQFTRQELLAELRQHPERFSPNVILRPVYQEWILPNIAFIGGGGEIAYWLQLKKVFESVNVPYPMMLLRNSFMFISNQTQSLVDKLHFSQIELFHPELDLIKQLVKRDSLLQVSLEREHLQLADFYEQLKTIAGKIDITLSKHADALQTQAQKKIGALEKKMLRAEKKKFEAQQRQLAKIKAQLFPKNNLQERVDNLMLYYAKWGKAFISMLYNHSNGLEQEFGILVEDADS